MADNFLVYSQINCLDTVGFIGGTDFTLEFTVYDQNGALQNIGGATVTWRLSPFGQSYPVLTLSGTVTSDYTFEVFIPAASTLNLSGQYTQQPQIESFFGQFFNMAQGTVIIAPKIS